MAQDLYERTLVFLKPDAVKRGLVGEIMQRFEKVGLKILALKMVQIDQKFAMGHYPKTAEWIRGMGEKTLATYKEYGKDPLKEIGTADPMEIGEMVKNWNIDYLTSGPLVVIVLEGLHAISVVRKMCGNTLPYAAEPGTIRGDFSTSSPIAANMLKRAVRNLIHASSNKEEAEHEINYWFKPGEISKYERTDEETMF